MIDKLIKYKYLSLVVLFTLLIFAAFKAPGIQVNTDISQFFHEDDEVYEYYLKIKKEIPTSENLILLSIQSKDSIFNKDFIKSVDVIQKNIAKIDNVKNVNSLLNLSFPVKSMFGIVGVPYITYNDSILQFNKSKILSDEISKPFINNSSHSLFLWIELKNNLDNKNINTVIDDLNNIRHDFSSFETYLWGRNVIDVSFKNNLIEEILKFSFWIFIFLCLSLLFVFKKPIALVYPLVLIVLIIILFLGFMSFFNKPISTLSNLFPTIILIVAVSDVLHLCIKYDKEWQKGIGAIRATKNTLKEIGWTTLITSFTTAIGFLVLYLSPMKAMRNFGLESAFLVLLTYVLTLFLIPLTFYTIKSKNRFTLRSVFNKLSNTIFSLQIKLIERQNKVLIVFGLILVVCITGISGINTNSRHYSIPKNTDLFNSFKFFEKNFGGSRTFELILESNNEEALNTTKNLEAIFKIHDYLSEHPKLDFIKSPVSYYKTIHQAYYPSTYITKPFTFNDKRIKNYNKEILKTIKTDYLSNRQRTIFKFNGQMQDYGKKEIKQLRYEILKKVKTLIGEKPINVQLSGIDVLIDISQQKSIRNTFYGLLIAIMVVSLTLGFVFKSPTLALVAVILNLIPLVMTAGIMGYFNMVLRAETALIFTVGFVIAVDDTIHLLSKLQWERKKGASLHEATITAIKECGKAIIATSIILVGGFFILTLSNQNEISTLGFLIGIIVVVTLFVDLVIAPIIILKWFKRYL